MLRAPGPNFPAGLRGSAQSFVPHLCHQARPGTPSSCLLSADTLPKLQSQARRHLPEALLPSPGLAGQRSPGVLSLPAAPTCPLRVQSPHLLNTLGPGRCSARNGSASFPKRGPAGPGLELPHSPVSEADTALVSRLSVTTLRVHRLKTRPGRRGGRGPAGRGGGGGDRAPVTGGLEGPGRMARP